MHGEPLCYWYSMNSMKLVIPLHSLYWSIHTKDESKRSSAFAFIFGVNWLWRCGVTASFGVFLHEIKCNGMTSFTEFMINFGGRVCHVCEACYSPSGRSHICLRPVLHARGPRLKTGARQLLWGFHCVSLFGNFCRCPVRTLLETGY